MKFRLCNIKVEGNVEQPITQTFIINLKWLALAIVVLTAAGVFLYLWRSRSVDSERYWLTESTGRIHKEGCMYYQKTKGFFVTGRKKLSSLQEVFWNRRKIRKKIKPIQKQ